MKLLQLSEARLLVLAAAHIALLSGGNAEKESSTAAEPMLLHELPGRPVRDCSNQPSSPGFLSFRSEVLVS